MRITVKTGGLLGEYLPEGSSGNQAELDVEEGAGPLDVISQLGMPADQPFLIILNGAVVPTAARSTAKLSENDELGIFPPLKGG